MLHPPPATCLPAILSRLATIQSILPEKLLQSGDTYIYIIDQCIRVSCKDVAVVSSGSPAHSLSARAQAWVTNKIWHGHFLG